MTDAVAGRKLESVAAWMRALSDSVSDIANSPELESAKQEKLLEAARALAGDSKAIDRAAKMSSPEPAIAVLPMDATDRELAKARSRQAVRRGTDLYLPRSWDTSRIQPSLLVRCALFAVTSTVQAQNDRVLSGDRNLLVTEKRIGSRPDVSVLLTGYPLCQFDRQVYAGCLEYYRDEPLARPESRHISTSFYRFATGMDKQYSTKGHAAIRASLLRLSHAQLRIRYNGETISLPKLLSVSFTSGGNDGCFRASDELAFQISESVADLFGPGQWAAVDKALAFKDDLKGWLASYFGSHSSSFWLPVETLRLHSGYESKQNFKASLRRALDQLKHQRIPERNRVAEYFFTKDEKKIQVVLAAWRRTKGQALGEDAQGSAESVTSPESG